MFNFFREIVPVRFEMEVGAVCSFVGTFLSYLTGGFDIMFQTLIMVMFLDFVTGIMAAWCENEDSKRNQVVNEG